MIFSVFHHYLFLHLILTSANDGDTIICCLLFFSFSFEFRPTVIELGEVDLNCPSNCQIHNTQFFGTDRQIIRRGQAFSFYARFQNREWDDAVDQAVFTVETGSHSQTLSSLSQSFAGK